MNQDAITQASRNPEEVPKYFMYKVNQKESSSDLISLNVMRYFQIFGYGLMGEAMAFTGIATNIINIIVFVKMGFSEPMNVSLLGLSISDLISCLTVSWTNLCLTPGLLNPSSLPFTPFGTHYIFGYWPHFIFVKITCCITAFIAIERCLCVTFPLRVKELITKTKVILVTVAIYTFVMTSTAPVFYFNPLGWAHIDSQNKTLFTVLYYDSEDKRRHYAFTMVFLAAILPITSFIATALSTAVLIERLKKNAEWRSKVTSSTLKSYEKTVSSKETKAARMVASISALFIACFTPVVTSAITLLAIPQIREGGTMRFIIGFIFCINFFFESTNASLNIFIYYRMSSNYKAVFDRVFRGRDIRSGPQQLLRSHKG